jgi:hypothetical protein
LRVRHRPVRVNRVRVSDDFTMVRPGELDGFWCADTSSTGVASRSEPMVLRSTSSTSLNTVVGNSIDSVREDFLSEGGVVGYNTGCQVSLLLFEDLEYSVFLAVIEFSDNLEGSEELGGQKLELFGTAEVLERHEDGSGLVSSILGWDGVVLEGVSSEQELSAIELHASINVSLDFLSRPGDNRSAGEVVEATLASLHLHLF